MDLLGQTCVVAGATVTAQEAEESILAYLREFPGKLIDEWSVLNKLCNRGNREENRIERVFFRRQFYRLVRERKVVRYRGGLGRGKIRISEAFV